MDKDFIIRVLMQYLGREQAEAAYADILRLKEAIGAQIAVTGDNMTASERDAVVTRGAVAAKREMTAAEKELAEWRANQPAPKITVMGRDIDDVKEEAQAQATVTAAMEAQATQAPVSAAAAAQYESEIKRLSAEQAALEAVLRGETAATDADAVAKGAAATATVTDTVAKETHAAATAEDTAAQEANNAAAMDATQIGRRLVSLADEMMRGQRGAMMATGGAFLKNMGVGLLPMIGAIAAFTAGNALWKYFHEADQEAEKLNEHIASLAAKIWGDLIESESAATEEAYRFYLQLVNTYDEANKIQDPLSAQLKLIEEQTQAQQKLIDLQEKQALAALKSQHLPPEQEKVQEALLRQQFGDVKGALDISGEQRKLDAQKERLKNDQDQEQKRFEAAQKSDSALATAKQQQDQLKDQQSTAKTFFDEAFKNAGLSLGITPQQFAKLSPTDLVKTVKDTLASQIAEAQAGLKNAQSVPFSSSPEMEAGREESIAVAQQKINDLLAKQKAISDAEDALSQVSKKLADQSKTVDELEQAQQNAAKAYDDLEAEIKQLTEETKEAQNALMIHRETFGQEVVSPAATAVETTAQDIARRIESGGAVTPQQRAFLTQWASQVAGHQVELSKAIAMAEAGAKNVGAFMTQVGRLAAAIGTLNINQIHELEVKVAQIEAQLNNQNGLH